MVSHGEGVFLYDIEGRQYLDGSSGAMTASMGHGQSKIADAMREQAATVAFTYRTHFQNQPAEVLAQRLTSLAPGDLNRAFFVSSGSEATEYAIRTVISYWQKVGRPEKVNVLGRQRSYHGMTMGALSLSGHAGRRPDYATLLHDLSVAPPAYAYRFARPGESEAEYGKRAAHEFELAILAQGPDTVAAVIVEPVVGAAGGVIVPPVGYLRELRAVCDKLDVLLIIDEIITGVGRTGDWFACEHEGVTPDLMLLGKGLSGGYAPLSCVLMREHLADALAQGDGVNPFGHTYSGNPVSTATGLAVLDLMDRDNVLHNVRERGDQLEQGLRQLALRYPMMADVRGRGLLWGFEFVTDPETKAAPPVAFNSSDRFVAECLREGLIIYPAGVAPLNNAVIISPPLIISAPEIELLLQKLDAALSSMEAQLQDLA